MSGSLNFENCVYDLDGTLIDSLPGIEASLRAALARLLPERTLPEGALRPRVGPPLPVILELLWPDLTHSQINDLVAAYREHYLAESCAQTEAFPGVTELLREFEQAGVRQFLLTNKPAAQAELILRRLGWSSLFEEISCPDSQEHPFASKAAGAVSLRERRGLAPTRTLLLGDALDDAHAAEAAGFAFVRAAYGYGVAAGHGNSSGEKEAQIGVFAELRSLVFPPSPNSSAHDHPRSLR